MSTDADDRTGQSSPRYPFIPLRKALDRARKLWEVAGDHSAPYADAVGAWGYASTSSGGNQTVAALKYYKIIVTLASKDVRKVKLTEEARKYFLDERPEKHAELHKYFALQPAAMAMLWSIWRDKPPSEPIARSTLKVDYNYSENAARELLAIYTDNLSFASIDGSDRISLETSEGAVADKHDDAPDQEVSRSLTLMHPGNLPPSSRASPGHYITQGTREDTINLPEGMVTLSFPETFSADSYEDLKAWLEFQQSRLKRWVREQ